MHYTGTKAECEAYNDKVTEGEGYADTTQRWAEVRKHPTKSLYAIVKHPDYEADMELVELDDSWTEETEL